MGLRLVGGRLVLFVPIALVGCPPWLLFTGIGQLPGCWSPLRGAPIRCLYRFLYVTFNTKLRVSVLWVRSWLRVLGSRSPHLFPLCAGVWGGGGLCRPCSCRHRVFTSAMGLCCGPTLHIPVMVVEVPLFLLFCVFYSFYCNFLHVLFTALYLERSSYVDIRQDE